MTAPALRRLIQVADRACNRQLESSGRGCGGCDGGLHRYGDNNGNGDDKCRCSFVVRVQLALIGARGQSLAAAKLCSRRIRAAFAFHAAIAITESVQA
jgi:hypothetical protein